MNAIYLLSDEAGAGKTALAVTLANLVRREGASAVVVNPFDDIHDEYYAKLLGQAGNDTPHPPSLNQWAGWPSGAGRRLGTATS